VYETADAIKNGADEIDMVINIGMLKDKRYAELLDEIKAIKAACNGKILKVIIETCLLTDEQKIKMCEIVSESGADFIKTSTGKENPAATPEAAYVMCSTIKEYYEKTGRKIGFKAAGGINSVKDALLYYTIVEKTLGKEWLNSKLFRIGTSRLAATLLAEITAE
jgi:deoxyribose-phosphate aldolase